MDRTMKVWIGCLACYNDGKLTGNWYPALEAGEVTTKALHAAAGMEVNDEGYPPGMELYGPHEEFWCMDTDNSPPGYTGEMSPTEAQLIAEAVEEVEDAVGEQHVDVYFEWLRYQHGVMPETDTITGHLEEFQDRYRGIWDTFRDYADQQADEQMGLPTLPCDGSVWESVVPPIMQFTSRYFDYESHARDLRHEYVTFDVEGGVAVLDA